MVHDVNSRLSSVATIEPACSSHELSVPGCAGSLPDYSRPLPAGFQDEALAPEGQVVLQLMAIGESLRQYVATAAARFDFTPQQALLVERLIVPRTMGQVADAMGCDKSNVTGMISRLEARGLVSRTLDEQDRRIKWLTLTEDGRAIREQLRQQIVQGQALLAGFDDAERDVFLGYLRRTGANLVSQHDDLSCAAADAEELSEADLLLDQVNGAEAY